MDTRSRWRYPDDTERASNGRSRGLHHSGSSGFRVLLRFDHNDFPSTIQHFASAIVGGLGAFGLTSGVIVLASAVMLQVKPNLRRTWGVLILIFSVLSFFGTGGFVVGAILGILGGVMTLRWKPPGQQSL